MKIRHVSILPFVAKSHTAYSGLQKSFFLALTCLACKAPPPVSTAPDGISCIATIANTLTGTDDPAILAGACGRTIDDLIAWLIANITPAKAGEALSPQQARYGRLLQKAQALKAASK